MVKLIKKPHQTESSFKHLTEKARKSEINDKEIFLLSLKQFDKSQGQNFHKWEENNILADAFETLYNYSHLPLVSQFNDKFKTYPSFPPADKTDFTYPKHISLDARWASMHVNGKVCLVGHIVKNTFFLVFLDCEHCFWKSELKNT